MEEHILHITPFGSHIAEKVLVPACSGICCWREDFEIVEDIPGLVADGFMSLFLSSPDDIAVTKWDTSKGTFACGCPIWWNLRAILLPF